MTAKAPFRDSLRDRYVQVLMPDGVLFRRAATRSLRTKAPALDDVEAEALKEV